MPGAAQASWSTANTPECACKSREAEEEEEEEEEEVGESP
jgi:ribosomal protein L12E/L44/L45/RPP1/RPP2